jgi:hypothetical protein
MAAGRLPEAAHDAAALEVLIRDAPASLAGARVLADLKVRAPRAGGIGRR